MTKGRPRGSNTYDPIVGVKICELIARGLTLNKISKIDGFPPRTTVIGWKDTIKEFSDMYTQARLHQIEHWAEEIIDIADDGVNDTYVDNKGNIRTDHDVVHRSRLRVDSRKWLLSKLRPEEYGDAIGIPKAESDLTPKFVLKRGPNRKSKSEKVEDGTTSTKAG